MLNLFKLAKSFLEGLLYIPTAVGWVIVAICIFAIVMALVYCFYAIRKRRHKNSLSPDCFELKADQDFNNSLSSQARSLLDSNEVTKEFSNSRSIVNLYYDEHFKCYGCAFCQKSNMTAQEAIAHFKLAKDKNHKTPKYTDKITLSKQLGVLNLLEKESYVTPLPNNSYKRSYGDTYIVNYFTGVLPEFMDALRSKHINNKVALSPVAKFQEALNSGHLLTKLHPKTYGNESKSHPGIPNAFLIIFEQLYNYTYRPSPRDYDKFAPGKGIATKWTFNEKKSIWEKKQVEPKKGPKKVKNTTTSMQKTSVTLASPFGFSGFNEGAYATGFAFDAKKCQIDDQYAWGNNQGTYGKWWYNQFEPSRDKNPMSFTGIQLQNMFSKIDKMNAPQNELLARPNLESVLAILGFQESILSRMDAYMQAQYVNTHIHVHKLTRDKVPVMLKTEDSEDVYTEYTQKQIAKDIVTLFCADKLKNLINYINYSDYNDLVLSNKTNFLVLKEHTKNTLRALKDVYFSPQVITLAEQHLNSLKLSLSDKQGLLTEIKSLGIEYKECYLVKDFCKGIKEQKFLSNERREKVDGIKAILKSPGFLSTNIVKRIEDLLEKKYKGWTDRDIRNAIKRLNVKSTVVKKMIISLTQKNMEKLCKNLTAQDKELVDIIVEGKKDSLDLLSRYAMHTAGYQKASKKHASKDDLNKIEDFEYNKSWPFGFIHNIY